MVPGLGSDRVARGGRGAVCTVRRRAMTRTSFLAGAAIGLLSLTPSSGRAQVSQPAPPVPPANRPPVSPYLNLLRQGQSPGLNYYNLVRPQTQFYSSINQLQQQVGTNREGISALAQSQGQTASTLPPTGFVPQFMNHRQYFMTFTGTGTGSGAVSAAPAAAGRGAGPAPAAGAKPQTPAAAAPRAH